MSLVIPATARPDATSAERRLRLDSDAVVLRPHADRLLVYEFLVGGFYLLNASARSVLELVDGQRTVAEVVASAIEESGGALEADDVTGVLAELEGLRILVQANT